MSRPALLGLMLVVTLLRTASAAEPPYVPAELEPWREWVLHGQEFRACPFFMNRAAGVESHHLCAWPGVLRLELSDEGAQFTQDWALVQPGWVSLPGDGVHWPLGVRADGRAVAVVARDGRPQVWLEAGRARISGEFRWRLRPDSLPIPPETGLLSLSVDGAARATLEREDGRLWLGERRRERAQREELYVEVYRKIADGIPLRMTTVVELDVSGPSREELLGPALLEGFVPLALESELPARLEGDGGLRVQLRAGSWRLSVTSRALALPARIELPGAGEPWPAEEVWSYESNERLRVSSARGGEPVDPTQVALPAGWRELPSFILRPGEALEILERSRGLSAELDNQLRLERTMWLDFDGAGFTARDSIRGTMRRDWRLDMAMPYRLASARSGGESLLITSLDEGRGSGVELRAPELMLETTARVETRQRSLPVTGWRHGFEQVRMSLQLPPGHRLLAAFGADRAPGAWIERWRLLDLFLVLIIAVSAVKVIGPAVGAAALLLFTLAYHEPGMTAWPWLNLIAALVLARVLPFGRFKQAATWYRNLSFAAVLIVAVPFVAGQARMALFPQLERPVALAAVSAPLAAQGRVAVPEAPVPMVMSARDVPAEALEEIRVTSAPASKRDELARYAPDTVVQTGPGIPSWQWNSYLLEWNGPVSASQTLALKILAPWSLRVLRLVVIAALAYLLFALVREMFPGGWRRAQAPPAAAAGLWLLAGGLIALTGAAPPAAAEVPPAAVLEELERRLTPRPECEPRCAELIVAELRTDPQRLVIGLSMHVHARVAVPVPGTQGGWLPERIAVDGKDRRLLLRDDSGVLWLELEPGIRELELEGPFPPLDAVELRFPERPRRISVSGEGWAHSGVLDGRMLTGSIQLTRIRSTPGPQAAELEADRIPPFVRVVRRLIFDLDWQVETEVIRVAPPAGAFTLSVPLLQGESPLTPGLELDDGAVLVAMSAGERSRRWRSALPRSPSLLLEAAGGAPWSEVWTLAVSPIWHLRSDGLPIIAPEQPDRARWVPEFHPLPGESLRLDVTRPAASAGAALALDSVSLQTRFGRRSSESSLTLEYRSTRGGQHLIRLPVDAEVSEVLSDGRPLQVRPRGGELALTLAPGSHSLLIRWQEADGVALRTGLPAVDLRAPSSNVALSMTVPASRWVLATAGPSLGPAVLYWAELVIFLVVAWLLGRSSSTPLRRTDWLLLGLGFSTFSWPVLMLVAAWLFLLAWRGRASPIETRWRFNALQVAVGLLSLTVLVTLVYAIPAALLGSPDMHIIPYQPYHAPLSWFQDQSADALPEAGVLSVPLWIYKAAILLWALWLSFALVRWLPWAWRSYSAQGLWRGRIARETDG